MSIPLIRNRLMSPGTDITDEYLKRILSFVKLGTKCKVFENKLMAVHMRHFEKSYKSKTIACKRNTINTQRHMGDAWATIKNLTKTIL